ncbi:MAG: SMI1/KNR4 family protein [Terracidiphilus sp.]
MQKLDCAYIKEIIASLKESHSQVFGADTHGFRLNPPLSEADVLIFERSNKVSLPEDFRQFLTCVGNGGAGPFYGIFPLGKMDDNFGLKVWQENDYIVGILSERFPHETEWNDLSALPSDGIRDKSEIDRQMEVFDSVYWSTSLVNGAIPICHEGCAIRIWLVVTGPQAGNLWEDRRSENGGLNPLRLSDGSLATFASWYDEWMNECLANS